MCMEDERIGRAIKSSQNNKTCDGSAGEVMLGPNKSRVRLIVWCDTPDQVGIYFEGVRAIASSRLVLRTTNMPLILDIKDYGDALTKTIYLSDSVGGAVVNWVEGTLTHDKV